MAVDPDNPRRRANESSGYGHLVAFACDLDLDEICKLTSYILFRLQDAQPEILSERGDVHLIDVGAAGFFEKTFQRVAGNRRSFHFVHFTAVVDMELVATFRCELS